MGWGVVVGAAVAVGTGVGAGMGVAVETRVAVGRDVGSGIRVGVGWGVAVGKGVGMTWGVTVGMAATMACARWSISRLSSWSEGPQAGRARARPAKASPATAFRMNKGLLILI